MEEILLQFVKSVGIEDADIEAIKSLKPEDDLTPYKEKIFNNFKETLKADQEFTSQFTKDFDNRLIGNQNKIKKQIRKQFGFDIKEDDLAKMPIEDLLKKAHEATDQTKDANLQELRTKQLEALEENERLKEIHKKELEDEKGKTTQFIKGYETKHKLQNLILGETPIIPKNIDTAMGAYDGYLNIKGWKLDVDAKGNLILLDTKTGGLVLENNAPVKVSETIKELFASFIPNGNGRGNVDNFKRQNEDQPEHPSLKNLQFMGKGMN